MQITRRWKLIGIMDMKCNTVDFFDSVKGVGRGARKERRNLNNVTGWEEHSKLIY